MKKILLVFDDYSESAVLEVSLKKMGFDVVGVGNEILIPYQILRFNPDVIVAFGRSKRVSTLSVGRKLRDGYRYTGKSILVFYAENPPQPADLKEVKMDATLTSPLGIKKLVQALGKVGGFNAEALFEKYEKYGLLGSEPPPKTIKVTQLKGHAGEPPVASPPAPAEPEDRYSRLTRMVQIDTKRTSFSKKDVKQHQEDLRKDWSQNQLSELDDLKRQFVEAMFRKK